MMYSGELQHKLESIADRMRAETRHHHTTAAPDIYSATKWCIRCLGDNCDKYQEFRPAECLEYAESVYRMHDPSEFGMDGLEGHILMMKEEMPRMMERYRVIHAKA